MTPQTAVPEWITAVERLGGWGVALLVVVVLLRFFVYQLPKQIDRQTKLLADLVECLKTEHDRQGDHRERVERHLESRTA